MTKLYEIWYAVDPTFGFGPPPTVEHLEETHRLVQREVWHSLSEEENLDSIFHDMQGKVWSPNGEARPLIEELGLQHTSMSVGDVVYSISTQKYYMVALIGFDQIS